MSIQIDRETSVVVVRTRFSRSNGHQHRATSGIDSFVLGIVTMWFSSLSTPPVILEKGHLVVMTLRWVGW